MYYDQLKETTLEGVLNSLGLPRSTGLQLFCRKPGPVIPKETAAKRGGSVKTAYALLEPGTAIGILHS